MNKKISYLFIPLLLMSAVGLGAGFTYSTYIAPNENNTFSFGTMVSSDFNFQSIQYYFNGGSGIEEDPYLVSNSQELRNLSKLWNGKMLPASVYVSLSASFHYEGKEMEPIGTSSRPFTGYFDGCGYSISGLKVLTSTETNVGMFGSIGTSSTNGTVQNFVLVGPHIKYEGSNSINIGIVAGYKYTSSTIQNIEIYGGTSDFNVVRAKITTGSGSVTSADAVVGVGESTRAGFVPSLKVSELTGLPEYDETKGASGVITASNTTYYLYNDNGEIGE